MTTPAVHVERVVPLVDSNERARQLQILDARIILGPMPRATASPFWFLRRAFTRTRSPTGTPSVGTLNGETIKSAG